MTRQDLDYLALGDSYTIGEGVDAADRWPVVLAAALREDGVPVAAPEIVATTGWTIAELDAALDAADPHAGRDLVSLLIGVNDQYRGLDEEAFTAAYARMLARAIGYADGDPARVFALSIPDWGRTPFGARSGRDLDHVSEEIDRCNSVEARIAEEKGVAWFDITASTRTLGTGDEQVVDDLLHPSPAVYRSWVEAIEHQVGARLRAVHGEEGP